MTMRHGFTTALYKMNNRLPHFSALAMAGFLMAGCAGLRDAFLDRASRLAPPQAATLGQTQRDEIIRQFGDPEEIDARRFGSLSVEVAYYRDDYVDDDNQPQYKFLACEFGKGVLTGYSYHDSADLPRQGFDDAARAKLAKGKSTRREAETALGAPSGKALLPTTIALPALDIGIGGAPFPLAGIPEGASEVWQYYSQNFDEVARKTAQQTLSVFFDGQGVYLGDSLLHELATKAP